MTPTMPTTSRVAVTPESHAACSAGAAQAPVLKFDHVTFSYDGTPVLRDVNVCIPRGDLVCVIGPNGGGKTTFVKLALGLLEPTAGRVETLGQAPEDARPRIGYMPQRVHLDPQFPVSVMDVVLMGRLGQTRGFGRYSRQDRECAGQALEEVTVADLARRPFAALSGGQRQRVLIARALACEPELLLLDEPTASLDPGVQEDLYRLLARLSSRLTIIMVSHDVGFVSVFFKTVVCIHGHAHVHPSGELTEQRVADMYGRPVRLVHPAKPFASEKTE